MRYIDLLDSDVVADVMENLRDGHGLSHDGQAIMRAMLEFDATRFNHCGIVRTSVEELAHYLNRRGGYNSRKSGDRVRMALRRLSEVRVGTDSGYGCVFSWWRYECGTCIDAHFLGSLLRPQMAGS